MDVKEEWQDEDFPRFVPCKKARENFISSHKKPIGHGACRSLPPAPEATGVLTPTGQFWPEKTTFVARLPSMLKIFLAGFWQPPMRMQGEGKEQGEEDREISMDGCIWGWMDG